MAIVGNLVANLTANTAGFTAPLAAAAGTVRGLGKTLTSSLMGPLGMIAGAAAGLGAGFTFVSAVQSFRESEQAGKKLESVLTSTGGAAGVTSEEIKALASDLQQLTNFEDDATVAAAGVLATFTQIKGDTFKDALMAAQDLSAVMGQDIQASVVQIGKALNDPIQGINALRRVGVSFTDEQKKQIKNLAAQGKMQEAQRMILAELQTEFGGAAQAMADPLTIVGNVIGDLGESLGSMIMPALTEIAQFIVSNLVPHSESLAMTFASWGEILRGWVAESLAYVKAGFDVAAFGVENFATLMAAGLVGAQLSLIEFGNMLAHIFTEVAPAYATWFLDNFTTIFDDIASAGKLTFENLFNNLKTNFAALWKYIASGGTTSLEFAWTDLLTGFEATTKEIPKIAERIPSELERSLTTELDTLQSQISDNWQKTLDGIASQEIKQQLGFNKKKKKMEPVVDEASKKLKGTEAMLAGSKEALSTIFNSMRFNDQKEMLDIQKQQLAIQQEQLGVLQDMEPDEVVEID